VIDKQMDKWIQLGVIEPSKNPWAAPAFIGYQNGKPHMVINYWKLNEVAISDEFPLSKRIFYKHYPAVNGYLPLIPSLDSLKWRLRKWNARN